MAESSTSKTSKSSGGSGIGSLKIPGVDLNRIPRGTPVAIFVSGFDIYTAAPKVVTVTDAVGNSEEGRVSGMEVGRLCSLAARFASQAIQSYAPTAYGGIQEINFYDSLEESYGTEGVHPKAPYTVVLAIFEMPAPTIVTP